MSGFPVGEYLKEELDARGWDVSQCATLMGGDVEVNLCRLQFLLAVLDAPDGHSIHSLRLDRGTAEGLERAFGSSADTWMNLDAAYHKANKRGDA